MMRFGALLITCVLAGCGPSPAPKAATQPAPSLLPTLSNVQSIIAEQLGLDTEEIHPELTFADLNADDLDLVEITMEVEDRSGVSISDGALMNAAGIQDPHKLCESLTIEAFAAVAKAAPKRPPSEPSSVPDDGTLHESQVGAFGDLSKLPNPNGLELVFIPSFEVLTRSQEEHLGRKLDDAEVESLREDAIVVALPKDMADKLRKGLGPEAGYE